MLILSARCYRVAEFSRYCRYCMTFTCLMGRIAIHIDIGHHDAGPPLAKRAGHAGCSMGYIRVAGRQLSIKQKPLSPHLCVTYISITSIITRMLAHFSISRHTEAIYYSLRHRPSIADMPPRDARHMGRTMPHLFRSKCAEDIPLDASIRSQQ